MDDLPTCHCAEVWPNQGHHPECPVKYQYERLRERVAELEKHYKNGVGAMPVEPDPDEMIDETESLRKRVAELEKSNSSNWERARLLSKDKLQLKARVAELEQVNAQLRKLLEESK